MEISTLIKNIICGLSWRLDAYKYEKLEYTDLEYTEVFFL